MRQAAGDSNGALRFSTATAHFDTSGSISVPVVRLDDVFHDRDRPIRFMKIDIEGAEYRALTGAKSIILRDRPTILIELFDELQQKVSGKSIPELLEMLAGWGYGLRTLSGEPFPGAEIDRLVSENVVFNAILSPEGR